ncbi:amidohydrolase family protein [Carboxydothermus pertinax]|uniref:Amidohydrolase n=1 Tax=Carboxydothermus pertinax TaxID=870242 RepID=A0A1L8CVL9_9THEO|nr:amidohydrolase family protein [Carboxydothermus pertinax]GAV22899.1 amidohydrolase [Carboxydothermus pertinax]
MSKQKIIDGHVHLLPDKLLRAIYRWFEENLGWEMPFHYDLEGYLSYLGELGISEVMALGYAHKAGMSGGLNEWLFNAKEKYPWIRPYLAVHQDDLEKGKMVREYLSKGFLGVKVHCFVQKVGADDPRFFEVFKILAEEEKGLVLHGSGMPITAEFVNPDQVKKLLKAFPGMKIMVAHLGLPDYLKEYLRLVDKYENLWLDTAYVLGNPKFNNKGLRTVFLNYAERIIYGSDFPIMDYSPKRALEELYSFNLGQEKEDLILYKNAEEFMGR